MLAGCAGAEESGTNTTEEESITTEVPKSTGTGHTQTEVTGERIETPTASSTATASNAESLPTARSILSTDYLIAFGSVLERCELTDTNEGDASVCD